MSDRLTVIIPPAVSTEEREQEALERCRGSLTAGNGYGEGWGNGYGEGWGNGYGDVWGDGYGDGGACGDGWGYGDGDGGSATHV